MKREAFTLIELLVVVAIIALLVAILVPTVEKARELARETTCIHNMKQWGLAFILYNEDHGTLPVCAIPTDPGGMQSDFLWSLGPYLGYDFDNYVDENTGTFAGTRPAIWFCPSAGTDLEVMYFSNWNVIGQTDRSLGGAPYVHDPFPISEIPRPGKTLVLLETLRPVDYFVVGGVWPPFGRAPWPPNMDYDQDGIDDSNRYAYNYMSAYCEFDYSYNGIAARHRDRIANCAFLDGHVEGLHINELMDPNRRMWGEDICE